MKNIEDKNKDQLDAIKDQGENQLDTIEKQKEDKPKIIEKDDTTVYLEDEIDQFFEAYPNSFNKQSKNSLRALAKNEKKNNYKNLSYRILFPNGEFHETVFLKTYGTLY